MAHKYSMQSEADRDGLTDVAARDAVAIAANDQTLRDGKPDGRTFARWMAEDAQRARLDAYAERLADESPVIDEFDDRGSARAHYAMAFRVAYLMWVGDLDRPQGARRDADRIAEIVRDRLPTAIHTLLQHTPGWVLAEYERVHGRPDGASSPSQRRLVRDEGR